MTIDFLEIADWRRQVAEIYADIRRWDENTEQSWLYWRRGRDKLFAEHSQSPLETGDGRLTDGVPFFAYDPAMRFVVQLVADDSASITLDAGQDGAVVARSLGRTSGLEEKLGGELTAYWITGYGGGVFLPFQDATSGRKTYGGGRYLLDGIKGADLGQVSDGQLILDFNFAYHPSCCYSSRWACPLSPPENRLPVAVCAGERLPD